MNKKTVVIVAVIGMVILVSFQQFSFLNETSTNPQNAQPEPDLSQEVSELEKSVRPNISYQTILENDEFKSGMQMAVKNHDIDAARQLQLRALEIANAAGLPESQINLLSGDSGLSFMQFLAKRQLFSIAFEERYKTLKGIRDLKLIYPEAKDLFEKSDALIAQRDQQILDIAQEMAGDDEIEAYLKQAQEQWLSLHQSKVQ